MTIESISKKTCTGCSACQSVCANQAISMQPDNEGFRYPTIDHLKCNDCGACHKICPCLKVNTPIRNSDELLVYGAWSLDQERRINSTSGGIFSELAEHVLKCNGSVVGAKYTEDFEIEHCVIHRSEDLPLIRQSKYAQSDLGNVFSEIKAALEQDRDILFCGTPCQVAGLKSHLGKNYENLILCDFICRGVNSPRVYRSYLKMLETKFRSQIEKVQFKQKKYGWNRFHTYIRFQNGKEYYGDRQCDYFMVGYLRSNLFIRPSCYQCQYKTESRLSDITLGDFWGIRATRPHLDADKGTSIVMLNTSKGKSVFDEIKGNLAYEQCTYEEACNGNAHLARSVEEKGDRELFFTDMDTMSFEKAMKKHSPIKFAAWFNYMVFRIKHRISKGMFFK